MLVSACTVTSCRQAGSDGAGRRRRPLKIFQLVEAPAVANSDEHAATATNGNKVPDQRCLVIGVTG
jgi:hypothetical protein